MTPEQEALLRDAEIFDENGEGLESLVYRLARELRSALANWDTACRAGQESMRERAAGTIDQLAMTIGAPGEWLGGCCECAKHVRALPIVEPDADVPK